MMSGVANGFPSRWPEWTASWPSHSTPRKQSFTLFPTWPALQLKYLRFGTGTGHWNFGSTFDRHGLLFAVLACHLQLLRDRSGRKPVGCSSYTIK